MDRLIAALVLLVGCEGASADALLRWRGPVSNVIDGDTIEVRRDQHRMRIRLHGIDAPELGQPFGDEAKRKVVEWAKARRVDVRPVTRDTYGRVVARVYLGGRALGARLVEAGLAWHYRRYSKSHELARLESEARAERRGLWASGNAIAPWNWRRSVASRRATRADRVRTPLEPGGGKRLSGNARSKTFHYPGCAEYGCANCTERFRDVATAREHGFRPHPECAATQARTRLRACRRDDDCQLVTPVTPCSCPPCGEVWMQAIARAAAETLRHQLATFACEPPRCPRCPTTRRDRGKDAACRRGRCVVVP